MVLQIGKISTRDSSVRIETFLLEIMKEILSIIPIKYIKKKNHIYTHILKNIY